MAKNVRAASDPFRLMADPQYCYFDAPRRDALARLLSGLFRGDGLFLLTGWNGIGKTTLLRHLADQLAALQGILLLSPAHPLACRPSTRLTDVFEACDQELGLREVAAEPLKVARRLQDLADVDRTPVLLLDDADLLSDEVLAEIATLAMLRSAERGLLSVVLAGTPDLAVRLAAVRGGAASAAPADDHVVALQPLTPAEARNLILFRLKVAGFGDGEPLTADALTAIAAHGQGVPLEIVRTARRALQIAESRSLPAVTFEIVAEATGGPSPEQPEAGRVAKLFESPTAPAPADARPRPADRAQADRAQVATPRGDPRRLVDPAAPSAAPAAPTATPTAAAEPPPAPFRIDKPADRRLADGSFAASAPSAPSAPSDRAPADPSAHLPADAARLPSTARPSADWLRRPRRPINGPDSVEPWLAAPPSVPPAVPPAADRLAPVWRVDDRNAAKREPLPPPSSTAGPLPPPRGDTTSIDEILRTPSGAGLRGTPPRPQRRRRIKIVLAGVALLIAALLAVAVLVADSRRGGESIGAKLPSHARAGDDVAAVPPSAPPSVPPPAAPLLTPEESWHPEPPEPPPAGVAPVERPDASTPPAAPGMAGSTATPASPSDDLPASPPLSPSAGLPASPPASPPVSPPASAARSAPSVPAEEAPEQGYLPPPKPPPPLRAAPPPNATTSRQPPPVAATPREPPSDSAREEAAVPPPARPEKPLTRRQEIEALLSEGDMQFEAGDLAAARSVLQEAYEKGSKAAALRMAHTFDPRIVAPGNGASPSEAILWYEDAARKGDRRARDSLNNLAGWLENAAASGDREAQRTLELWRAPPEDDAPAPEEPAP